MEHFPEISGDEVLPPSLDAVSLSLGTTFAWWDLP